MVSSTVIRVLSAATHFNGQFLKVPLQPSLGQDVGVGLTKSQGDASLFNVPQAFYGYYPGFEAIGGPNGPSGDDQISVAYVDTLAHAQPIQFAGQIQLDLQPFSDAVLCNLINAPGSDKFDRLVCNTPPSAPFHYGGFWAICGYTNNQPGDLFLYDHNFYGNEPPPGCTAVELQVIGA
ncbi:hypothetical protein B0A50_02980 [Salinomyces thailandicus]|uniref:Uncharacterized protein n=1 Tax=Salinomyces thailandicus TaxID=706561 RepID=A0A4U0U158_9PEZI|nr:hypothetical protein B0A50_02980 [Salinomyces thailandica]